MISNTGKTKHINLIRKLYFFVFVSFFQEPFNFSLIRSMLLFQTFKSDLFFPNLNSTYTQERKARTPLNFSPWS